MASCLINFMRKNRLFTRNADYAEKSIFQWSEVEPGIWATSVLGIINGFLIMAGWVLVVVYPNGKAGSAEPGYWQLKRWNPTEWGMVL